MLHLKDAIAKIANFNPRAERHGEDTELAGDLKLEIDCSGSVLDFFDSYLRAALFREVRSGEQQELIENGNAFTAVRFPRIGAVRWDEDYPGYELHIGGELGLSEPLQLVDVTLRKFQFLPREGGTLALTVSAICHPDTEEAGALCALIQSKAVVTLIPPIKVDQPEAQEGAQPELDHLDQAAQALAA